MQGIESATVQYDEEVKPGLARTKQKTAMVAVWTTGHALEEDQVKAIRNIVGSAYAGLDRQSITITDMTSNVSYGGSSGPGGASESESIYANHKLKYERDWQRKIADQLKMIAGAVVNVNVEMSPEILDRSQSVKIDPKPVTVTSQEFTKESTTAAPGTAGRPGAVPNGVESPGNRAIAVSQPTSTGPESTTSESRSQVQNLPGQEQLYKELAPLVPKKVTAAIDLPWSYYVKVWRERNPTPAGQPPKQPDPLELARIETETKELVKEKVRNLLPPVIAGTDPYPHITVSTYTDLAAPAPAPASVVATGGEWLADNWRTIALLGLGCFCLLMVRSMVRSPATSPAPAPLAVAASTHGPRLAAGHEAEDDEPEPAAVLRKRFESSGPDLKAELRELVKENPDAAANVLRMWIGDAV